MLFQQQQMARYMEQKDRLENMWLTQSHQHVLLQRPAQDVQTGHCQTPDRGTCQSQQ